MKQFLAVPLLAVTLAACGGGGGSPSVSGPVPNSIWEWVFGKETGGETTVEIVYESHTVTTGGDYVNHNPVQEGDFIVTYADKTEVIDTTTTYKIERTTTSAITRVDTYTCVAYCE